MLVPTVLQSVNDVNNCPLRMHGQVSHDARLGTSQVKLKFFAFQRVAAPVILGCDFFDSSVESIHVQRKELELLHETRVPIVCKLRKRDRDAVPLPLPQHYPEFRRRVRQSSVL